MKLKRNTLIRGGAVLACAALVGVLCIAWMKSTPVQYQDQTFQSGSRTCALENVWYDPGTSTITGTVTVTDTNGLLNYTAGTICAVDYDKSVWPITFQDTSLSVTPTYDAADNSLTWAFSHVVPAGHRFAGIRLAGGTYYWTSQHSSLLNEFDVSLVTGYVLYADE